MPFIDFFLFKSDACMYKEGIQFIPVQLGLLTYTSSFQIRNLWVYATGCLKAKSTKYSEVSIIRPGRSRLLEFEI